MHSSAKIDIDASSIEDAVVVMTRMFDAPREKVWEAFTKPEHVARWYGGHGFSSPVCEMDVRPGGVWRHVMRTPDGSEFPLTFVYVEVVKPEKLVWRDVDYGEGAGGRINIVALEDFGNRTKWTLTTRFTSLAERDAAVQRGFARIIAEGCDRLNEVAASL